MKATARLPAVVLLAGTFVIADPTPAFAAPLRIVFTAETRGNLEPCDCPGLPLGGLARRAGFMDQAGRNHKALSGSSATLWSAPGDSPDFRLMDAQVRDTLLLRLDVGGFLPEGEVFLADRPGVLERYVSLLMQGLDSAGIEAGVLDHRARRFLEDVAPGPFASIAPGLLEADPPDAVRLFDWNGSTVAILALEETLSDSVVIAAAGAAWQKAGSDGCLLVLGRADGFSGRRLARLTRADLVFLSRGSRFPHPLTEGRSLLVACGAHGREVGDLLLGRVGTGDPGSSGGLRAPGGRVEILQWTLRQMDDTIAGDPILNDGVRALLMDAGPELGEILTQPSE